MYSESDYSEIFTDVSDQSCSLKDIDLYAVFSTLNVCEMLAEVFLEVDTKPDTHLLNIGSMLIQYWWKSKTRGHSQACVTGSFSSYTTNLVAFLKVFCTACGRSLSCYFSWLLLLEKAFSNVKNFIIVIINQNDPHGAWPWERSLYPEGLSVCHFITWKLLTNSSCAACVVINSLL